MESAVSESESMLVLVFTVRVRVVGGKFVRRERKFVSSSEGKFEIYGHMLFVNTREEATPCRGSRMRIRHV